MNSQKELRQIEAARADFRAWVVANPNLPDGEKSWPATSCEICGALLDLLEGPREIIGGAISIEMACPNRQRHSLSVWVHGDLKHGHYNFGWIAGAWRPATRIGWI